MLSRAASANPTRWAGRLAVGFVALVALTGCATGLDDPPAGGLQDPRAAQAAGRAPERSDRIVRGEAVRREVEALLQFAEAPPPPIEALQLGDYLAGTFAGLTGDPESAAEYLGRAAQRAPDDANLLDQAVRNALSAGDFPAALELSAKPFALGTDAAAPTLVLLVDALASGRYEQALVKPLDRGDLFDVAVAKVLAAWARMGVGDAATALDDLDQRFGVMFSEVFLYNRGFMLAALGRDAEASVSFARVIDGSWPRPSRMPAALLAYAGLLDEAGETLRAISMLSHQAGFVGDDIALAQAVSALRAGHRLQVPRLDVRQGAAMSVYMAAMAYAARFDGERPIQYLVLALALDPDLHEARLVLARLLAQGHHADLALRQLALIRPESNWHDLARLQTARINLAAGRTELALQQARSLASGDVAGALRVEAADILHALGNWAEAEAVLTELLEAEPLPSEARWRVLWSRGAARRLLGQEAQAEVDLVQALELSPDQPELLNYLGHVWIERGQRTEQAFQMIRRAAELEPNAPHIVDSLGWTYFRLGQYGRAVYHLERAVQLAPSEASFNDHLGDAYWRVGRDIEAKFQWSRALELLNAQSHPGGHDRVARIEPLTEVRRQVEIARLQQKLEIGLGVIPLVNVAEQTLSASPLVLGIGEREFPPTLPVRVPATNP